MAHFKPGRFLTGLSWTFSDILESYPSILLSSQRLPLPSILFSTPPRRQHNCLHISIPMHRLSPCARTSSLAAHQEVEGGFKSYAALPSHPLGPQWCVFFFLPTVLIKSTSTIHHRSLVLGQGIVAQSLRDSVSLSLMQTFP